MSQDIFDRAAAFIWMNARLLDRRLFGYHFQGGAREDVLQALRAYQNPDGGFGQALEPDIRCPASQPVPVQHALEILDAVGFEPVMVERVCAYLQTITTAEGGVPWLLPTANAYPRAPWWNAPGAPPAALNPTAAIVGLLYKNGFQHPWIEPAAAFCWAQIAELEATEIHDLGVAFTFLSYAPDRERAEAQIARLAGLLLASDLVAEVANEGYVRKPLDWAPAPDHPLRRYFSPEAIAANLDYLVAAQQADGGWNISWPAISPACELEWRGWVTLNALRALQAHGRLAMP